MQRWDLQVSSHLVYKKKKTSQTVMRSNLENQGILTKSQKGGFLIIPNVISSSYPYCLCWDKVICPRISELAVCLSENASDSAMTLKGEQSAHLHISSYGHHGSIKTLSVSVCRDRTATSPFWLAAHHALTRGEPSLSGPFHLLTNTEASAQAQPWPSTCSPSQHRLLCGAQTWLWHSPV